jgi:dTDP-4-amino-4,6-dideoxygalactose transaminase
VASGTLGTWLALRALGIGPGDEVIASPYGWHQVAHAVGLTGARLVFADINYWSGCLDPVRAAAQVTPATKAILAGNVNGHPAAWKEFRALADERGLKLIEDSTEAIGSRSGPAGGQLWRPGDIRLLAAAARAAAKAARRSPTTTPWR